MTPTRDVLMSMVLFHQGRRLSADAQQYVRLDPHPYAPVPFTVNLPPKWPLPASTYLQVSLTARGELDPGWLSIQASINLEYGSSMFRPGLVYVGEPTADPSCLIHFPSTLEEHFPGMVTLALRRSS